MSDGGYTELAKRVPGGTDSVTSTYWQKLWADYAAGITPFISNKSNNFIKGFGDLNGDFWLGLDNMYLLTNEANNNMMIKV